MVRVKGRRPAPLSQKSRQSGHQPRSSNTDSGASAVGGSRHPDSNPETRHLLLEAAKRLFAQRGFDGTTVKELADEAGVNISLVSYHFGGKEGLYRACLLEFGVETLTSVGRLLVPCQSSEEFKIRLGMTLELLFDVFVKEPELSQLAFREADLETPLARDIFQASYLEIFKLIVKYFEDAKLAGILKNDVDPHTVASIFFGSISHFARMDRIGEKYFGRTIKDLSYKGKLVDHFKRIYMSLAVT